MSPEKRHIYTFKDLLAIADELGYPGERQGSAATLDSNIDLWVYTERRVPVEASPLLEQWIDDHNYAEEDESSSDTSDESGFSSEEAETKGAESVSQVQEPNSESEAQTEITPPFRSGTSPVTVTPDTPEPVPPLTKSKSSSAPSKAELTPAPAVKVPQPPKSKAPKLPKVAKAPATKAPRAAPQPLSKKADKVVAEGSTPKSLGKAKVKSPISVTKAEAKGKSLHRIKKPSLKSLSALSAYQITCSSADVEQINQLLVKAHSVTLVPTESGLRIKDCGRTKALGGRSEGREPTRWTPEELEVVTPLRSALKLKSLPDLLRMLKEEPVPAVQAKNLPESARLIDLLRETKLDPATGEQVRCADSILRMRATVLLLRYEASKITGRRVYY